MLDHLTLYWRLSNQDGTSTSATFVPEFNGAAGYSYRIPTKQNGQPFKVVGSWKLNSLIFLIISMGKGV